MSTSKPTPEQCAERARHIFAQLMDGRSIREIAESEALSVRRVQQIVAEQLGRRGADPAADYALLQIARLEQALELLGRQIDEGKAAAVPAFLRVIEQLTRLTETPFYLASAPLRLPEELSDMKERLERLAAAREILAERRALTQNRGGEKSAKQNAPQVLENTQNRETTDFAAQ